MFSLIIKYSLLLTIIVFAVKAALFIICKSKRWQLLDFLYFGRHHFVNSLYNRRETQKQVQNLLSVILLVLLAFLLVCFLLLAFSDDGESVAGISNQEQRMPG